MLAAWAVLGGGGCQKAAPPDEPASTPVPPAPFNFVFEPTGPAPVALPAASASVAIQPGESIQEKVNAYPAGTTFLLKAGTHVRQSVVPKARMAFIGEPGAILDGGGRSYAFWLGTATPYPDSVRIAGLVIQHYAPPVQMGAVRAGGHTPEEGARDWTVADCEIRENATGGIRLGHRMRVLRNNVHHNGQIGVVGIGDSVLVERNEIAYNNFQGAYDPGFEAGGTKFVQTRGLVARGNYVHHNTGPGLWTDADNIDVLYEGNRVEDNAAMGIFHEISYRAVIRNNQVARNGFTYNGWLYGAGIVVASSSDVEIHGNAILNNFNGVTVVQQNRGAGTYGPYVTQNVHVHDNQVTMAVGRTGIGQDTGDDAVFTTRNNRFQNNVYWLGAAARYFEWANKQLLESEWRAYGQDVTGTFVR